MANLNPVRIGTILVMREEFERVSRDESRLTAVRHRAAILVQICDELLALREKEASRGS